MWMVSGSSQLPSPDSSPSEVSQDSDQDSLLPDILTNLSFGSDLSRVTLPTRILEPKSILERITNFMAHPEIFLSTPTIDDPVKRFVSVIQLYLSGWHIRPKGVKKPLNSILGEQFTCYWEYADDRKGYYISEQISHHPPVSGYFFMAPDHKIRIDGTLKPISKYLGNSVASIMEGVAILRFLDRRERYVITQPNMYARGIIFGKMMYELGDKSSVHCPESGLIANIEFKTKGYFSGQYNAITGIIKNRNTGKDLYEISGFWNSKIFIKNLLDDKKELLFDAETAKVSTPLTRPVSEQRDRESQKLWKNVIDALNQKDYKTAAKEKTIIEDMQRREAMERVEEWKPRLFRRVESGPGGPGEGEEDLEWILSAAIDGSTPEIQTEQICAVAPVLPSSVVSEEICRSSKKYRQAQNNHKST